MIKGFALLVVYMSLLVKSSFSILHIIHLLNCTYGFILLRSRALPASEKTQLIQFRAIRRATPTKTIEVPGYAGKSTSVKAGRYIRITDLEGEQVGDLFAISAEDHYEYLSPSVTRLNNNLTSFPRVGECFFSTKDKPILAFVADHSAGPHDMLFASCNNAFFEAWGESNHPNCRDNYFKAAAVVPYLCLTDWTKWKSIGIAVKRSQTIANGHEVCDFRYCREKKECPSGWPPESNPEWTNKFERPNLKSIE